MGQKPETVFRTNIVRPFLETLTHTKFFAIQQLAIIGDPDFLLCCRGRFVALELKDIGEVPTPLQQWKLDEVTRTGGIAVSANPENWEKVAALLTAIDGDSYD